MSVGVETYKSFRALLKGMKVTFVNMFRKPITTAYPYEKRDLRPDYRGTFIFNEEICTGCDACARICPSRCIYIETHRTPDKKLAIDEFTINFGLCCQCNLCVEVCPVDCLFMVDNYEASTPERGGLILTKEFLNEQWRKFGGYEFVTQSEKEYQAKLKAEEEKRRKMEEAARKRAEEAKAKAAEAKQPQAPAPAGD